MIFFVSACAVIVGTILSFVGTIIPFVSTIILIVETIIFIVGMVIFFNEAPISSSDPSFPLFFK